MQYLEQIDELRTFRERVNVAAVETDNEESLVPSEVLYAPEDEDLEEEQDAVVLSTAHSVHSAKAHWLTDSALSTKHRIAVREIRLILLV